MTEAQKVNVRLLRQKGYSYGKIAQELDIKINTVRSFCNRDGSTSHNAYKDAGNEECKDTMPTDSCHQCGQSIRQRSKMKKRRFCGDACRHRWWNANRDKVKSITAIHMVCPSCGLLFESYAYQRRKYCSHACYIKGRFGVARHDIG